MEKDPLNKEIENRLSKERILMLLKHNREITEELRKLYPNEKELIESYKALEVAFDKTLTCEIKYRIMKRLSYIVESDTRCDAIDIEKISQNIAERIRRTE